MIDFEDAEWTAILAPGTLLGICVVLVVLGIAYCNSCKCIEEAP